MLDGWHGDGSMRRLQYELEIAESKGNIDLRMYLSKSAGWHDMPRVVGGVKTAAHRLWSTGE